MSDYRASMLRIIFWGVLVAIFTLALSPGIHDLRFVNDKVQHVGAFVALGCLASATFPAQSRIVLIVWLAIIGGAIEILQMLPVVGRDAQLSDWVADCLASLLSVVAFRSLQRKSDPA